MVIMMMVMGATLVLIIWGNNDGDNDDGDCGDAGDDDRWR